MRLKQAIIFSLLCSLTTGCMVGPNFTPPKAPRVSAYTNYPIPIKTVAIPNGKAASKSQTFMLVSDIPAEWWYLFHSPILNNFIQIGLANSPNLEAAYAALRQSQETLNAQIGNSLLPGFDANLGGQRQRMPSVPGTETAPGIFNLYNASVNVSYALDIFGGERRQIESLQAQVDYQQFQLIAAYLSLTSNIVTSAVTIASLQSQLIATKDLIRLQENQLSILEKQFALGSVSNIEVLAQKTLVAQSYATLPTLEKKLSQARHALTVLLGVYPNTILPTLDLDTLYLPKNLPVTLPSRLVIQRPDLRASLALLHAANAQIGVNTANLFPKFNITGSYGWQAAIPSQLFEPASLAWNIGSQITQPIFHGGALLATRRASIAAFDQAYAQYKQTVLQGFQNVADSLRAVETDARTYRAYVLAENAASQSLRLTESQYRLGGISYVSLIIAEQQLNQAKINRIQSQAARYTDTAALFQSLGGGWWHKEWCIKECL